MKIHSHTPTKAGDRWMSIQMSEHEAHLLDAELTEVLIPEMDHPILEEIARHAAAHVEHAAGAR